MSTSAIETMAGELVISTTGAPRSEGSYYDVPVRLSLGQRTVCGEVSVDADGHAIGQSVDAWVSGGIRALLDAEVCASEHGRVLGELAAVAGSCVEEVQS